MSERKFAVFDIDGTLLRWQLYHAVVNTLAKDGHLGPAAYDELRQARMIWKRRENPGAFKDYERHMVSAYDAALHNLSMDDFKAAADKILAEYKDQVHVYTRDLVKKLKDEDYFLLAISGSHHEMVGELAKAYGFDDWVGAKYIMKDGKFTGEKIVPSDNKAAHLEAFMNKHKLTLSGSYGVGDTISDATFLTLVEHPIAFNPDQLLFERAKSEGWNIVVERKNVIYELTQQDGSYFLSL